MGWLAFERLLLSLLLAPTLVVVAQEIAVPPDGASVWRSFIVNTTVSHRFASTEVTAVFDNPSSCTEVVDFTLQLPRGARLSGATMSDSSGCAIDGVVSGAADAEQGFNAAVTEGTQAVLIQAFDVESLRLQLSLPPRQVLRLTLRYDTLLHLARGPPMPSPGGCAYTDNKKDNQI